MKKTSALILAAALCTALPAWAGITRNVQFQRGQDEAVYRGKVRGHDFDRYIVRARKGQVLNVTVDGGNIVNSVNYLGKQNGVYLDGVDQALPYTGRYEIRVMQTRNGARKSKASRPYSVHIQIR